MELAGYRTAFTDLYLTPNSPPSSLAASSTVTISSTVEEAVLVRGNVAELGMPTSSEHCGGEVDLRGLWIAVSVSAFRAALSVTFPRVERAGMVQMGEAMGKRLFRNGIRKRRGGVELEPMKTFKMLYEKASYAHYGARLHLQRLGRGWTSYRSRGRRAKSVRRPFGEMRKEAHGSRK
jgi:hypothetical protein